MVSANPKAPDLCRIERTDDIFPGRVKCHVPRGNTLCLGNRIHVECPNCCPFLQGMAAQNPCLYSPSCVSMLLLTCIHCIHLGTNSQVYNSVVEAELIFSDPTLVYMMQVPSLPVDARHVFMCSVAISSKCKQTHPHSQGSKEALKNEKGKEMYKMQEAQKSRRLIR